MDILFSMKGLGFFLSIFIVVSVVLSAFADNCESTQTNDTTAISCNHGSSSNSSSDTNQEHHCLYHCSHHVSLLYSTQNIEIQELGQEMTFNYERPVTSFLATKLFRPPIS
jgi:hypothetical protein